MPLLFFTQTIIVFFLIFFICFIYGQFFLNINKKFFIKSNLKSIDFVKPVLGYSIITTTSYYLFFNFNMHLKEIIILFLLVSVVIFLTFEKKQTFVNFCKVFLFSLPVFLIFIIYALIIGEQFYIFRGNYWDNMNYISSAILVKDFQFSEILQMKNGNMNYNDPIIINGSKNISVRPISNILLSIFFFFKIKSIYFSNYLFKVFLLIQIFCSFYFLISQLKIKSKALLSIVYIFSFWSLYVFEIDAQSQLGSIAFFLAIVAVLLKSNLDVIFLYKSNASIFILLCISLFIFYPEFYLIFSLFFVIFVFLHIKNIHIIKSEGKVFAYLVSIFLLFTLPSYHTNYIALYNQTRAALSPTVDYWGYYGFFLLGDAVELITIKNIQFIKELFKNNPQIIDLFLLIKKFFINNEYFLIPINIIPSLAGLYFLTVGKIINPQDYIYLTITIFLNIYILNIFKNNILQIFDRSSKLRLTFLSFFLIFIFASIVLIIRSNYWTLIKLYSYIGPIIFLFFSLKLKKNSNKKINFNILFLILIFIFPFYKYSESNHGIGKLDNFPSIINSNYKKNIKWFLNKETLLDCNKITFNSSDKIINGYIAIKLYDYGFKQDGINEFKRKNNQIDNRKNNFCEVKLNKTLFKIIK
jgi:hypothetical protein